MCDHAMRKGAGRSFASSQPQRAIRYQIGAIGAGSWLIAVAVGTTGCGDGERTGFPVNIAAQGALVSVEKGDTTVGFARGRTRVTEKTDAFKISKSPITKKEYKACQEAKICKEPKLEECSDPALATAAMNGPDDSAAVCVGRENAQTYCKWVGGRLPNLAEWLRAARGPSVQEYPWGSSRATCAQHPKSVDANPRFRQNAGQSISTEGCDPTPEGALLTKKHAAGAAVGSGMQDVLVTPAELLDGNDKSPFAACSQGQQCVVYGLNAGSIDSVKPYSLGSKYAAKPGDEPQLHLAPEAYGFRCLIEK